MEEKKFVAFKKEEFGVKEYIKESLGKGKISNVSIEYTPVGEKIVVATSTPGYVIGRKGEKIDELTTVLKKRFKLDNPHIEIKEITNPNLDAQLVADEVALLLEREGPQKFKVVAYRALEAIMRAGALGGEIVLSGKLPAERARSWRFSQGFLKKTGEPAKLVNRAMAQSKTVPGIVGVKVSILPADVIMTDIIKIDQSVLDKIMLPLEEEIVEEKPKKKARKASAKASSKKPKAEDKPQESEQ